MGGSSLAQKSGELTAYSRQLTEEEVQEFKVEEFKDCNLPSALFTWGLR